MGAEDQSKACYGSPRINAGGPPMRAKSKHPAARILGFWEAGSRFLLYSLDIYFQAYRLAANECCDRLIPGRTANVTITYSLPGCRARAAAIYRMVIIQALYAAGYRAGANKSSYREATLALCRAKGCQVLAFNRKPQGKRSATWV